MTENECNIHIDKVQEEDEGIWTCIYRFYTENGGFASEILNKPVGVGKLTII